MASQSSEEKTRQREVVRDRVKFLLEYRWEGNQRQMARDLAVTQGLISKIVNGQQGAGKRFLATLANQPGVNADWLLRGEGQPLSLPPKGTLPVALGVLPGTPQEHPHLLTGQRHPVAEALDRASRYWLELQPSAPLLRDNPLRLLIGDLLLMETDPAWTSRFDLLEGRLCGFCWHTPEPSYLLGKLYSDSVGLVLDALAVVLRFATPPAQPGDDSATSRPAEKSRSPSRRTIRLRENEEGNLVPISRQPIPPENLPTMQSASSQSKTFTLQDLVAVCVYLVRPSPGFGREETARS